MNTHIHKYSRQSGIATLEFAVVALAFLIFLFGVIETGRMMYTWNMLSEATRIGARTAAICEVNDPVIKMTTLLDQSVTGGSFFPPDLAAENIQVDYLSAQGLIITNPVAQYLQINYVRVTVVNYVYEFLFPGTGVPMPFEFSTTLPREALGVVPNEGTGIC